MWKWSIEMVDAFAKVSEDTGMFYEFRSDAYIPSTIIEESLTNITRKTQAQIESLM